MTARLAAQTGSVRRIAGAAAFTVGSRMLSRAAQLVFLVVAARLLALEEFAVYSYVLALALTVSTIGDTGVALAAAREVSSGAFGVRATYVAALPVVVAGAVLTGTAMAVVLALSTTAVPPVGAAVLVCLYVAVNAVFNCHATLLRAAGIIRAEAWLQAAGGAAFVLLAGGALVAGAGLTAVFALLLAKECACLLVAFVLLRGDLRADLTGDRPGWRRLLRIGVALSVASSLLVLGQRLGTLVLANAGDPAELARYAAAQRLLDTAFVLVGGVGYALLPALTHLHAASPGGTRGILRPVLVGVAVLGAVGTLVCAAAPGTVLGVLFGAEFRAGGPDLRILSVALVPAAVVAVGWYVLVGMGGQRDVLLVAVVGLAVAAPLALGGVPVFGASAAAWSYVASSVAMALVLGGRLRTRMHGAAAAV